MGRPLGSLSGLSAFTIKGGCVMFHQIIKTLGLIKDFTNAKECYGKRWFTSKTLWANFLAVLAFWLQWKFQWIVLPPDLQVQIIGSILGILNMVLRVTTTQPVVAKESEILCRVDPVQKE